MSSVIDLLLIEDDEVDAMNVERAFKKVWPDVMVAWAQTGENALELLQDFCPSIILLDLSIPDLHGLDVLNTIRGRDELANVPVIICSGSDDPQDEAKAKESNASAYAIKPISPSGYTDFANNIKTLWCGTSFDFSDVFSIAK